LKPLDSSVSSTGRLIKSGMNKVPEKEEIDMGEYGLMGGECMSWVRKRCYRTRFGILLIVIGLLWFGQRAGWFPLGIFGPLVLLTLGVWMIATPYFHKR
jgi:hypothetical protein